MIKLLLYICEYDTAIYYRIAFYEPTHVLFMMLLI